MPAMNWLVKMGVPSISSETLAPPVTYSMSAWACFNPAPR